MQEEKYESVKVTYTFTLPDNADDLKLVQQASDMKSAIWEVYNMCRAAYKHGNDEKVSAFAHTINDIIGEFTW